MLEKLFSCQLTTDLKGKNPFFFFFLNSSFFWIGLWKKKKMFNYFELLLLRVWSSKSDIKRHIVKRFFCFFSSTYIRFYLFFWSQLFFFFFKGPISFLSFSTINTFYFFFKKNFFKKKFLFLNRDLFHKDALPVFNFFVFICFASQLWFIFVCLFLHFVFF